MKWICTVCQYVHEGDSPPDVCPVCGQGKEMFKKADETPKEETTTPGPNAGKETDANGGKKVPRNWVCTVCGYVHEGDAPPDNCPVCGKPWSVFIPKVEGTDGPSMSDPKPQEQAIETSKTSGQKSNRWRCTICNYIHEGPEPPGVCPICGAGKEAFVPEADGPEHHHRGLAGLIEKLHLHPVAAHFPNGALPLAFFAWLVYLVLGDSSFERTSFYLMLVATLAVPFTGLSGWSDAKHRFGTTTTGVFPEKKLWSFVLTGVTLGMAGWRLSLGWTHVPTGVETAVFTVLLVVATGIAARLGMLGGKLVFGH